jgi:hypothetical protein
MLTLTKINNMPQEKVILGSEEWCSLELGIHDKARVDSGAKNICFTCINIAAFIKNKKQTGYDLISIPFRII